MPIDPVHDLSDRISASRVIDLCRPPVEEETTAIIGAVRPFEVSPWPTPSETRITATRAVIVDPFDPRGGGPSLDPVEIEENLSARLSDS